MKSKKELGKGSLSSINLAIEKPNSWFLSDNNNARIYALNIGLNVMGTVRVIEDAAVEGKIESKEELMDILNDLKNKDNYPITEEMKADILKVVDNRIKENNGLKENESETDLPKKVKSAIEKIESIDKPLHPFELFGMEHGYGWMGLTLPILKEVRLYNIKNPDNMIKIDQIKEKFGSLRIYLSGEPEYLYKMICKAEYENGKTCEICGAKGTNEAINGWYTTLCDEHRKAKIEANFDNELEDKLYKESLDIRNYGWTTGNSKEKSEEEEAKWKITVFQIS